MVLGGDVWDLLNEITIYMRNPMQYYEKGVKFVRVIIHLQLIFSILLHLATVNAL